MFQNTILEQFKTGLLNIDPVFFIENNLTLDGRPFRLYGNGYKCFCDIYRYIGIQALQKNSKPVVLVKGRQVGATTMAAALELFFTASGLFGVNGRAPMRIMHAFPLMDIAFQYTKTKLNPMITGAIPDEKTKLKGRPKSKIELKIDKTVSANDSLQFKQFENGNYIQIESTGLDANRLRGRTVDLILFDEFQDISRTAFVNTTQILAKSQYGIPGRGMQVLFGTPKQKGTLYWDVWQNSNQQYYYLNCEKCNEFFPLYTPESDDWEKIWIDDDLPKNHPNHGFIVKCTHCEHEQDKRTASERGKWVATKDESECQFIGYHINQLYMPEFRREDIINKKPENNTEYTERLYRQEVLGEFYSGDAALLSPEEVAEFCADYERGFAASISMNDTRKVYMGCDWGQKVDMSQFAIGERDQKTRGQSYSSCVVLSVEGAGLLNIEYAQLLKRNDPEYKKAFVDEIFRRYSVHRAVGDYGFANDLTFTLHQDYGERFLGASSLGYLKKHATFDKDDFPQLIKFDKNYYIAELLDLMKHGKVRFPYKSYEKIGWLVTHCTSMEIKPTLDRAGNIKITYVKGSTPNDGFMALLNAYLAYKFDITGGFNINNPNKMKNSDKKQGPPIIGGYLPGLNSWKK